MVCKVSGGHLNPAVTIALFSTGHISAVRSAFYIVAQCVGATVGAFCAKTVTSGFMPNGFVGANTVATGLNASTAMFAEMLLTTVLVRIVIAVLQKINTILYRSTLSCLLLAMTASLPDLLLSLLVSLFGLSILLAFRSTEPLSTLLVPLALLSLPTNGMTNGSFGLDQLLVVFLLLQFGRPSSSLNRKRSSNRISINYS